MSDNSSPELPPEIAATDETPPKQTIPLGIAIALFVVLAALVSSTIANASTRAAGSEAYGGSYIIGAIIGSVVIFPGIVLALCAIAKRMRNPRSMSIALLIVWSVLLLSSFASYSRNVAAERANDSAEDFEAQIRELNKQMVASDDLEEISRLQKKQTDLLRKAPEILGGVDSRAMKLMTDLMARQSEYEQRYLTQVSNLIASPLGDPSTLTDKDEVEVRVARWSELKAMVETTKQNYEKLVPDLRLRFHGSGLPKASWEGMLLGFETQMSGRLPQLLRINDIEIEVIDLQIETLRLFEANWSDWSVDEEGEFVLGEATYDPYIAIQEKIVQLADEQNELQLQLLGSQ